ncbi:MAG: hypothetical protein GXP16_01805 [Gammaproteobacteria bacterium]|nr:hypothetical protein [Gammaproteobacteria bacterium]
MNYACNNLVCIIIAGCVAVFASTLSYGALVAEYRFDEVQWRGLADEVQDSSGNGFHGRAIATDTTRGLLCRAADLRTTTTADYISIDHRALDRRRDFSIATWIRSSNSRNKSVLSAARAAQANEIIFWFSSSTTFRPYLGTSNSGIRIPFIWDNNWHHMVWTRRGSSNCFYLDGRYRGCRTLITGQRHVDPNGLVIGQEQDSVGGSFVASQSITGLLDEFLIFNHALTTGEVRDIYNNHRAGLGWDGVRRVCPAFGANRFEVSHDGAGIYCATESIGVAAVDTSGNVVTSYVNTVMLDTSTGSGTWRLQSGNGVLSDPTPNDGLATYTFVASDQGEARFSLEYSSGPTILDIDVVEEFNPSVGDDDTEGALVFAASGFTLTANALPNPPPPSIDDPLVSTTAGAIFDVHVSAYGTTRDDPACGVIEAYSGIKQIETWQSWVDPDVGTIRTTLDGNLVGANEAAATSSVVSFSQGQAVFQAKYKDAGRLRIHIKDAVDQFVGTTDAFVSRPANFVVTNIEDASGVTNPASTRLTGAGFVAAGESFVVEVDVLDAEGSRLPNFGNETAGEQIIIASASLVAPVGGLNGSTGDGSLSGALSFVASGLPGRFINTNVAFDEVGIIRLRGSIADGSYLGTGDVNGQLSANVGRFFPHRFSLSNSAVSTTCDGFLYMDAPHLSVSYAVDALALTGAITQNYDLALMGASALANVVFQAEAGNNGVDISSRFFLDGAQWQLGRFSVSSPTARFLKVASVDGPYLDTLMGVGVVDNLDSRVLAGLNMRSETTGDCDLSSSCSAISIGNSDVYYGRMMVLPAIGAADQPLNIDLEAQVFNAGGFMENIADDCSDYIGSGATLSNFQADLSFGETTITGPETLTNLVLGHADSASPLQLSAPGLGNEGVLEVQLQVPSWLQYDWQGAGNENPRANASFGQYRGHDRIIFWQYDP